LLHRADCRDTGAERSLLVSLLFRSQLLLSADLLLRTRALLLAVLDLQLFALLDVRLRRLLWRLQLMWQRLQLG